MLQFGQLVAFAFLAVAQLGLDRLHLLVEVIFALGLFHLALDPAPDAPLHLEHAQFAFHETVDHFEPLDRVGFGQQRLLVGDLGADMRSDGIRQLGRVLDFTQRLAGILRQFLVQLGIFVELLDDAAHHAGGFRALGDRAFAALDLGDQHAVVGVQRLQRRPRPPLDQHPHGTVGQLQQLQDRGDHADVVQIVALGVVAARIELGEQEDILVVGSHCRLQRRDGFLATHEQRHDHAGKNDDIAQGEQGQRGEKVHYLSNRARGITPQLDAGYGGGPGAVAMPRIGTVVEGVTRQTMVCDDPPPWARRQPQG